MRTYAVSTALPNPTQPPHPPAAATARRSMLRRPRLSGCAGGGGLWVGATFGGGAGGWFYRVCGRGWVMDFVSSLALLGGVVVCCSDSLVT